MKPRLQLLLVGVFFLGFLFARMSYAQQEERDLIYTKVTLVNQATGDVELRFMMVPDNLRMVCNGDARTLSVGDYVKVRIGEPQPKIEKTAVMCSSVRWYYTK